MSTGSTAVTLPDGCFGLQMESDGREFNARPGSKVEIPDRYMPELRQSNAVRSGIIRTGQLFSLGTPTGRRCTSESCNFLAQAWSQACPRCGAPTQEETDGSLRTIGCP